MNLEILKVFEISVNEGSINRTADRLGIHQTFVSSTLINLENELGFEVYKKGKGVRSLILTNKGAAFYRSLPALIALFKDIDDIRTQCED